jgi:acrylyl-CoA reductase (NADPH)
MDDTFQALMARQAEGGQRVAIETISTADLPEADVLVAVEYSSFNYKDGLALAGKSKILRNFPIVPGIDFAGTVLDSASGDYAPGDKVILTGWGVGESWSGGFAERARVKSEWLVKVPEGMTTRHAMAIGTAGLTAMLSVIALERAGLPPDGKVLVTGASGGVGSVATRLLAKSGRHVAALTGRRAEEPYLRALGAGEIIDRAEYQAAPKPLGAERWQGAVDAVGGDVLASVIANMAYGGSVAACGLAGGTNLPSNVFPFILRGVNLLGIDSVRSPNTRRIEAWDRLARDLTESDLVDATTEVALREVPQLAERILAGGVRGRTVVRVR